MAPAPESFRTAVAPPAGLRARARQGLRGLYLSGRTLIPPRRQDRFLRCLNAHFVFAEDRARFARTIAALKNRGDFLGTDDAVALVRGEAPLDGRYFHLSYDDGLTCLLENAAPILHEAGVPAIAFVNSAMAADPDGPVRAAWLQATNYRAGIGVLDWQGLAALRDAGFEIGAHTRTHRRLSDISADPAQLQAEIADCKAEIEAALDLDCRHFAWPYGHLAAADAAVIAAIRAAGYVSAFGSYRIALQPGRTNPYLIPRHHFEANWPRRWVTWFAQGGIERVQDLPDW